MSRPRQTPTNVVPAGTGYNTRDGNFARATVDIPVYLTNEYAKPGHVVCYDATGDLRIHTRRSLLKEIPTCNAK